MLSEMYLKTDFHQIRMNPEDVDKIAFNTKYSQVEYLAMPMRLCDVIATFRSLMNRVFYNCLDVFLVVCMYDLLVFSKD